MKFTDRKNACISWILLGVTAATMSVAGCATKDGSTTCDDFVGMSYGDQQETVENMVKATNQDDSSSNLLLTIGSVRLYCMVHPTDSRIDGIYSG